MAPRPPVAASITDLAARLGLPAFVEVCTALMGGADRADHVAVLGALTAGDDGPDGFRNRDHWHDYWVRTWGARGLLHVWDDSATVAVVAGLGDEHWRPAEMCLKVAARHEVAGSADPAAALATHGMARVRARAVRALGVVGDTEHVAVVVAACGDPDPEVVREAVRARRALGRRLDVEL